MSEWKSLSARIIAKRLKLQGMAGRYVNLSDDHIRTAFQEMFQKLATAQEFVTKLYREKSDVAW